MRDVKKILEMRFQNYSQRQISTSLRISRDTIRKIFNAADSKKISWPLIKGLNEADVQKLLFDEEVKINLSIKQPDFDYIHTIERFIKNAHFYDSTASIEAINYNPDRKLDRSQMEELATNSYIEKGLNIIFVGASGCGKTWLSNALGVHACRDRKTVLYIRLPELFSKFEEMRIQGKYNEYLKKLGKYDLVILDEFLLKPTNETERSDLLELMEIRCNRRSTIFCSQYSFDGWHQLLDGGPIADAILDRIINSSYLITLYGKSLRETYSKLNSQE